MGTAPVLQVIPVAAIHPSPYQYRTRFDDAKQQQLMDSLQASGLSTPILVRPLSAPTDSSVSPPEAAFELVSGERRWRAAKALGWEGMPAVCESMTDAEAAARVVTENEVRSDANILERAAGYRRLTQPPCNFNLEQIAKRYGYSGHSSVKRIIDLLEQPALIRDLVSQDTIGEAHVRFLSRIKDLSARCRLAKRAAEEGWTVKMIEKQVAKLLRESQEAPRKWAQRTGPSYECNYKGFRCSLVGEELVLAGRNFKRREERLDQFLADYRSAIECVLRNLDGQFNTAPLAASAIVNEGDPSPLASPADTPGQTSAQFAAPTNLEPPKAGFTKVGGASTGDPALPDNAPACRSGGGLIASRDTSVVAGCASSIPERR